MLKIEPVFSEKIWGGTKLKELGFHTPKNKKIGEAWIVSSYKGSSSKIKENNTLREFYRDHRELFNNYSSNEFPLLVKILDANEDLSIQVHPSDKVAHELENYPYGKAECWYILDAKEGGDIIVGTKADSKEEAMDFIEESKWNEFLETLPITKGDVFDISTGTVHAIKAGTLVYELQQSSDVTYRIYDYDRVDKDGNTRTLHIEKSLESIDYGSVDHKKTPFLISTINDSEIYSLVSNDFFSLEKWVINGEVDLSLDKDKKHFLLVTVINGKATINGMKLKDFESGIITSEELSKIKIKGHATILVGNPK